MASEEQISRNLTNKGISIGEYEFFPLHSTTIKQYKQAKIIQNKGYGDYADRKPDGLLVDRRNKTSPQVITLLEYKKPKEFQTDKQKKEAVEQCNDLCQVLEAKIGIITDGIVTYWINPNNLEKKNEYKDRTNNTKRSYSFILNDDKQKLQKKFHISEINQTDVDKFDDETKETYQLIERILSETNPSNSILKATEKTDPTPLAKSVWQSIYISTKDNPTACLYNVVEIFIFKFLSDLGVLKRDYSFDHLIKMYEDGYPNKEVLEHYATKSRKKIKDLFHVGDDGTGIINGTIFVNRNGEPVLSQDVLFKDTIYKYRKFGYLRNIRKEFKTKLFETFLKQSKDTRKLGQFFTPRKVVKAIVEMADLNKASFICDPFCGVGGFVLEPFQVSTILKSKFTPKNGKINSSVKLLGYDTGREDSEEQRRTIILAKANMLIYISDLIEKNPTLNKEFEKIINNTFNFLSDSNLGTLKLMFDNEEDKPDLIMTNPPYITSGMTSLRKQIVDGGLSDFYSKSGKGAEGLCLKWVISNLKKDGSAFIILPDAVFNIYTNKVLRDEITNNCFINCLISLPIKTFFTTQKKTYIIGITKKQDTKDEQDYPVFTYLVSSIGETLDVNRFEIEDNDLDTAKNLFNQYKGSQKTFKTDDPRCKVWSIDKFKTEKYWNIDKWWSKEEREKLGILKKEEVLTLDEFKEEMEHAKSDLSTSNKILKDIKSGVSEEHTFETISIGDLRYFLIERGGRIRKQDANKAKGRIPVYSGSKEQGGVIGYVSDDITKFAPQAKKFNGKYLTVNANGSVGKVFLRNEEFYLHDDVNAIKIISKNILYEYLRYELQNKINLLGYDWTKKLYKQEMEREISVDIPTKKNGDFDVKKQRKIADKYRKIDEIKKKLNDDYERIMLSEVHID